MLPQSIRWRIQLWHGFILVALVSGLIVGFYLFERRSAYQAIDTKLHELVTPLLPRLRTGGEGQERQDPRGGRGPQGRRPPGREMGPPGQEQGPPEGEDGFGPPPGRDFGGGPPPEEGGPGGGGPENFGPRSGPPQNDTLMQTFEKGPYYYSSWGTDGSVFQRSKNSPEVALPDRSSFPAHNPVREFNGNRELMHFLPMGDCVLVGIPLAPIQANLHRLAWMLTGIGFGVVTIGMLGGWWLAGRTLRPIEDIRRTAGKIAEGKLAERIPVTETGSELGELSTALNSTFERLEKSFEQQVRFTADASHELRTPISVILTQVQLSLSRERSPQEYRQTLETCERAAERMRTLANQLLELARVDSGELSLLREECDLSRIARESLEFIEPLALQKKAAITSTLPSVRIQADAMKLGQVFVNILNNAVFHNAEGTEISVVLKPGAGRVFIEISDHGSGIPPEALPHLFERFFRVDKSRARNKGSNGLGLAICKAIVEAHGGKIRVESTVGAGTTFFVELPLTA